MQGLGNCMRRRFKPATEESLETSRAITRFFERFYCPKVMLVRDRTLERRLERAVAGGDGGGGGDLSSSSSVVVVVGKRDVAETKIEPDENRTTIRSRDDDVSVLSSDLDGIRLKDECADCAHVSSTIKILDEGTDMSGGGVDERRKIVEKIEATSCEVAGNAEVVLADCRAPVDTKYGSYELVEDPTSRDLARNSDPDVYGRKPKAEGYVAPEVDGYVVGAESSSEAPSRDQPETKGERYVVVEEPTSRGFVVATETQLEAYEARERRRPYHVDATNSSSTTTTTTTTLDESVFVDLTSDEPRSTWKQTILKRYCDGDRPDDPSSPETLHHDGLECANDLRESRIMIADSSSKSQRESSSTSLATALRDRGPCVIPIQPNHSLPLRPVPPAPTRSSMILKPAVLKLSKPPDVVEASRTASSSSSSSPVVPSTSNDESESSGHLGDEHRAASTTTTTTTASFQFGEPARLENFVAIAFRAESRPCPATTGQVETGGGKRKVGEDDRERNVVGPRESRKRRRSHEADSSQSRHDGGESAKFATGTDRSSQRSSLVDGQDTWHEKGYAASVVVSTTDDSVGRERESAKTVPPLRLKKVVCEGTGEGNHADEVSAMSGHETNYRIVTGATPQPPTSTPTSTILFWTTTSVINEKTTYKLPTFRLIPQENGSRRSPTKNDGYKLKYRRNRLKQKLRELRTKRIDLNQQMASVQESNPLQSTRLKQMMNCNEKQMENLSKLLKKLCDTTTTATAATERRIVDGADGLATNGESVEGKENASGNFVPSPEPPKLSPSSPLDYATVKSPGQLRDSPPVLPRVCLTIPPNLGADSSENLRVATPVAETTTTTTTTTGGNVWPSPDRSPSHLSIVLDVSDEENIVPVNATRTSPVVANATTIATSGQGLSMPTIASSGQGLSMPIIDTEGAEPTVANDLPTRDRLQEIASENRPRPSAKRRRSKDTVESAVSSVNDDISELFGFALADVERSSRFPQDDATTSNSATSSEPRGRRDEANEASELYAQLGQVVTAQQQVPAVGNVQQSQTNRYESAGKNVLAAGFVERYQNVHTVTSSSNQPITIDSSSTMFSFDQTNLTPDISQQRSMPTKKSNDDIIGHEPINRNDESRIMTEQFPTLGNWVKARTKSAPRQHAPKMKSKQTPDAIVATSTDDTARIPDASKIATSGASIPARSVAVNAPPQWNADRWQHYQQRQQRLQQQLLQQVPAKPTQPLPPRPGICPPISVTQFYPTNYAIDLYENPAFRYHSTICPYNNYQCRLHPGISMSGYHPPIHDPTGTTLRPTQYVDKRLSPLQESMRHYTTDMLKYHSSLAASGCHHPSGLDFERCRSTNSTRTGATAGCLPPLLLPPPPPLTSSSQQTLTRSSLSGLAVHNGQYGRSRMIPDVVAAAAAAAVVAAASLGQQNTPLTPCGRQDRDANSTGVIADYIAAESSRLCKSNGACDRLASSTQTNGSNDDSRHNGVNVYHKFRNLDGHGNRVNMDGSYATASTFVNNVSTVSSVEDVVGCQMASLPTQRIQDAGRNEPLRNQTTIYDAQNLDRVGRAPPVLVNGSQCSSCGLPGSLFKCLGCETAYYCNERCQERHWIVHGEKCPKKMPKLKKVA